MRFQCFWRVHFRVHLWRCVIVIVLCAGFLGGLGTLLLFWLIKFVVVCSWNEHAQAREDSRNNPSPNSKKSSSLNYQHIVQNCQHSLRDFPVKFVLVDCSLIHTFPYYPQYLATPFFHHEHPCYSLFLLCNVDFVHSY